MLNRFRPAVKKLIYPVAERVTIPANYITLIGFILAFISALMYWRGYLLLGVLILAFSGFMDILDGAVARLKFRPTTFGGFFDSTLDRFSDGIIIIGITAGGFTDWITGMFALHSALMVSYIRARAEVEGLKCSVGFAERAERIIIIIIGSLLGYLYGPWFMSAAILLLTVLGYFTAFQRIFYSWKEMG